MRISFWSGVAFALAELICAHPCFPRPRAGSSFDCLPTTSAQPFCLAPADPDDSEYTLGQEEEEDEEAFLASVMQGEVSSAPGSAP